MDKEKIINLANKGLELVDEMDRKSMYKNLLGNLFFEMRKEAINYTRCCKSDSEQLQAFKKDDIVLLDNKVKVRVMIPEPKVLIDEEESGCKMWVETKRLVKQE
jgi:hypothetical protein